MDLETIRLAYDLHRYGASWADLGTLLDCSADSARHRVKYHALRRGWVWPVVREVCGD